jgi:hypothetical protein
VRFITLTSQEGYAASRFPVLVPAKRRRNCYRVDEEQMIVEVTNGRSEIYDILTHLTFMFMEADKIRRHAFHERGGMTREWEKLEAIIKSGGVVEEDERELALTYVSTILGRTFRRNREGVHALPGKPHHQQRPVRDRVRAGQNRDGRRVEGLRPGNQLYATLRERIGHHLYGERWATRIKRYLLEKGCTNGPCTSSAPTRTA